MKLAIHNSPDGFHPRWIDYCTKKGIPYKLVNCYSSKIIQDVSDCDALLWHFSHVKSKDLLIAQGILFALEHTGFKVFPDFRTAWHFDDKVAQKYLLECISAPLVPSNIFFDKDEAKKWIRQSTLPKVFKLRRGASSSNVILIESYSQAMKMINRSFGSGFSQYNSIRKLKEAWRKYQEKQTTFIQVVKSMVRLFKKPKYTSIIGKEKGYAYFQDFIPGNESDIRIIVIGKNAFGLKRMVRKGDFRASGSGNFRYDKGEFDERCIKIALDLTQRLNIQCVAYDFLFDENNNPLIVEISYGFSPGAYDHCPGYWDEKLNWHEKEFNPYGWIIESIISDILKSQKH